MEFKAKCVSKNSDDSGSRVVFGINTKIVQTQQGKVMDGDTMITFVFKDPNAADIYTHGYEYTIETKSTQ